MAKPSRFESTWISQVVLQEGLVGIVWTEKRGVLPQENVFGAESVSKIRVWITHIQKVLN